MLPEHLSSASVDTSIKYYLTIHDYNLTKMLFVPILKQTNYSGVILENGFSFNC